MFKLGEAYQRGRGVAADPVAALSWYTLAAQHGYDRAGGRAEALAATLDAAALDRAEQQAAAWRRDNGLP
jgi:TPR repeat protein